MQSSAIMRQINQKDERGDFCWALGSDFRHLKGMPFLDQACCDYAPECVGKEEKSRCKAENIYRTNKQTNKQTQKQQPNQALFDFSFRVDTVLLGLGLRRKLQGGSHIRRHSFLGVWACLYVSSYQMHAADGNLTWTCQRNSIFHCKAGRSKFCWMLAHPRMKLLLGFFPPAWLGAVHMVLFLNCELLPIATYFTFLSKR